MGYKDLVKYCLVRKPSQRKSCKWLLDNARFLRNAQEPEVIMAEICKQVCSCWHVHFCFACVRVVCHVSYPLLHSDLAHASTRQLPGKITDLAKPLELGERLPGTMPLFAGVDGEGKEGSGAGAR